MNVLLVNEASGVHRNLKLGLQELGVSVSHRVNSELVGRSDYDGVFARRRSGVIGGIARNIEPLLKIASLKKYDVISLCNTITAVHGMYAKYMDLPIFRRKAKVLSHYAIGCDEIGIVRRGAPLEYKPCKTCLESGDSLSRDCENLMNPRYERSVEMVSKYFDFGASAVMEYDHASRAFEGKPFRRIPFPVRTDHIPFVPAKSGPLVRIIHTPTRRGFKGTDRVLKAIEILALKRKDFEFKIVEGLQYEDYLAAIRESDIVVDQVYSQSCGINAIEMLAMGKIVLTGSTEAARSYFGLSEHPAFNAHPDPEVLANALSDLLDSRGEFSAWSERGRSFVKEFHDPVRVARMFLDSWTAVSPSN